MTRSTSRLLCTPLLLVAFATDAHAHRRPYDVSNLEPVSDLSG